MRDRLARQHEVIVSVHSLKVQGFPSEAKLVAGRTGGMLALFLFSAIFDGMCTKSARNRGPEPGTILWRKHSSNKNGEDPFLRVFSLFSRGLSRSAGAWRFYWLGYLQILPVLADLKLEQPQPILHFHWCSSVNTVPLKTARNLFLHVNAPPSPTPS